MARLFWMPFRTKKTRLSVLQYQLQAADQAVLNAEASQEYHTLMASNAEREAIMLRGRLCRLHDHIKQEN